METVDVYRELVARSPDVSLMPIDDLHKTVFWSGFAKDAFKLKIDKAKDIGGMDAQIEAWLEEGRAAADLNFAARARRGELAKETKKTTPMGKGTGGGSIPSGEPLKWERLGYKSERAMKDDQLLYNNPELVEEVKAQAKESEDFPSVGAVRNLQRAKRSEEMLKRAKEYAKAHNQAVVDKEVKQRPKVVVEYFDSLKRHKELATLALSAAKQGLFSDESINIIKKKHQEISTLYAQIEAAIGGR